MFVDDAIQHSGTQFKREVLAGCRVKPKSAERISAAIDALGLTNPIQPAAGA